MMEEWRVKQFETDNFMKSVETELAEWLNEIAKEVIDPNFFFLDKLMVISADKLLAVISITWNNKLKAQEQQQGRLEL